MYQAVRGTADILPGEQPYWRHIEQEAAATCRLYGYRRIDSPTFEETGLFTRSVGQETDIVEKEMYTFEDKGGKTITLRPEGTASVCRAYQEHGMHNLPQPVKLYYLASIFRYERPQAGRLREHHQFGCEAIGDDDPALDAEVIDMAWRFLLSLNLRNLSLQLNSIGCKRCRPGYLNALTSHYHQQATGLCNDCQTRLNRNPLRLLDCKQPACQPAAREAPRSADYLCPECGAHFSRLQAHLELLNIPFNINHRLVRGLDYYTRTVFEIQPEDAGGQSTLGGGGRYDDLIEELGGKPTPAIGFAAGIERIILNLKKQGAAIPTPPQLQVFIAYMGDEARNESIKLASHLRQAGISTAAATGSKSLKAQMRQANSLGAGHTVIIGEEEIKTGTVTVRDMANARQSTVPINDLPGLFQ
ncbi:histidine--tRNA ligase [Chloroflexota bacterium]